MLGDVNANDTLFVIWPLYPVNIPGEPWVDAVPAQAYWVAAGFTDAAVATILVVSLLPFASKARRLTVAPALAKTSSSF